jgi:hypothetical protein
MRRSFVFSIVAFVVLAFILLLYSPLALAQSVSPIPSDAQAAMGELQKEPFRAHMAFLAADLLEGRGTGARGHEIAARYVAAQFEAIGLKPAGQDGAYFQRVPFRQLTVEPEKCAVSITENGLTTQLKWGDDFLMRGNEVYPDSSIEAPVVFVGYSVRTPDGSYDDYAGVDVKGKIVAMFGGAPPSLPSELQAHLSALREKLRNARDHGAIGVIRCTITSTSHANCARRGIGREIPGAWVFVAEHAANRKSGLAMGLLTSGLVTGLLLGSLTAIGLDLTFGSELILRGAWRIPFVLGGIFGFIAVLLRRWLAETTVFQEMRKQGLLSQELPLWVVIRDRPKAVLASILSTWHVYAYCSCPGCPGCGSRIDTHSSSAFFKERRVATKRTVNFEPLFHA